MELVGDRDFSINMISKSGTTTEPAVAFRIFKEKLRTSTARRLPRSVFTVQLIKPAVP